MKRILITGLLLASGVANANCYSGAKAFADRINTWHKLGLSRSSIEQDLRKAYGADNIVSVGNRYSAVLSSGELKGGYTKTEYERFANSFATNACNK